MTDNIEPTPTPPKRSRSAVINKFITTLLILILLWLVLIYGVPYVAKLSGVPTNLAEPVHHTDVIKEKDDKIAELNDRIDQLEGKLKTFEDVIATMPKPSGDQAVSTATPTEPVPASDSTAENERVTQLEDKLAQQQKTIDELKTQISTSQGSGMHTLASLTAFGQLKETVLRGDAYTDALNQLKILAPDQKAQDLIAQLAPTAEKGLVTLPMLQAAFESTVPVALAQDGKAGSLLGNLRSLISVRKVGQQNGSDDESIIARAEAKLNHGDVAGSSKELAPLSPASATAFAAWNNQAQAYVHVRETLDALQLALMASDTPAPSGQ